MWRGSSFIFQRGQHRQQSRRWYAASGFALVPHTVPRIPDTARWVVEPTVKGTPQFSLTSDQKTLSLGADEGRSANRLQKTIKQVTICNTSCVCERFDSSDTAKPSA